MLNINFQDCYTQRNLSNKGRKQAIYYGDIIRRLEILIDYPISVSPFCRAIETGSLAFGINNIQIDPFWIEIYKLNTNITKQEQTVILNNLKSRLELEPAQGRNKLIIAHSFPDELGLGQIPDMGTVVVKPMGKGNGYKIVDKLSLADL